MTHPTDLLPAAEAQAIEAEARALEAWLLCEMPVRVRIDSSSKAVQATGSSIDDARRRLALFAVVRRDAEPLRGRTLAERREDWTMSLLSIRELLPGDAVRLPDDSLAGIEEV
ncbi:MAG: hypothetical protein AAFP22_18685 [Planctomycetota bacterium]